MKGKGFWMITHEILNMEQGKRAIVTYCADKNLDAEQIDFFSQEWSIKTGDIIAAFKRSNVEPDGLCNDMETMPYCVLYYDANGVIHETEHTERIRKKDEHDG